MTKRHFGQTRIIKVCTCERRKWQCDCVRTIGSRFVLWFYIQFMVLMVSVVLIGLRLLSGG